MTGSNCKGHSIQTFPFNHPEQSCVSPAQRQGVWKGRRVRFGVPQPQGCVSAPHLLPVGLRTRNPWTLGFSATTHPLTEITLFLVWHASSTVRNICETWVFKHLHALQNGQHTHKTNQSKPNPTTPNTSCYRGTKARRGERTCPRLYNRPGIEPSSVRFQSPKICNGAPIRLSADFSKETLQVRSDW